MTMPGFGERLLIVVMGLLQSLLLYAAWRGAQDGFWPFTTTEGPVYWYTLVLALPLVMMLSLVRLNDARFWQHVGGLLPVLAGLAGWAAWHVSASAAVSGTHILLPFAISLGLGLYVLTPFLQARLDAGRWRAPYPELVRNAWQNGLTLLLALVFVALSWGVLILSARLFLLIGFDVLDELLRYELFVVPMSGALFGTGIVIARTQQRTAQTLLHILVGLFTGLLPVLSVVILVFLGSLAYTGVESLWEGTASIWQSTSVTVVLSVLLGSEILFLNAVLQDGTRAAPYPLVFRGIIRLALLALPLIAALALYSLWLRIGEYGWSVARFWAMAGVAVLALHSVGYALMQLVPHRQWLGHLPRVNVALAFVVLAVVIAGNSPLLDPHRLTASSQLERLRALPGNEVEDRDLAWLGLRTGQYGRDALRTLLADARRTGKPALADRIARQLSSGSPENSAQPAPLASPAPEPRPAPLPGAMALQPDVPAGAPPLDPDYLAFLRREPGAVVNCAGADADCIVVRVDANRDGVDERLLCNLALPGSISCRLALQQGDGSWRWLTVVAWPRSEATLQAARAGDVRVAPARWQSLQAGETGPVFHLYDPQRNAPGTLPDSRLGPMIEPPP